MRVIQDRVLVEPIFAENTSISGIFLGEGEMTHEGIVLAVGPGKKTKSTVIPSAVNVGDRVLFMQDTGTRTKIRSQRVLVLREQDLLAVVEAPVVDAPSAEQI